jgi:hypothetical protein
MSETGITFNVSDVKPATSRLDEASVASCLQELLQNEPESYSGRDDSIVPCAYNGLAGAMHLAFDQHRPLVLDPDCIWLSIAQSFATHVDKNAEELRHHFVQHEGQETVKVQRDSFVKGSPHNDWVGCFDEFSSQIKEYIGKKHDLIVADFSTTDSLRKAVSEVVLMDSMKSYFKYECHTCCGIPTITLEGTTEDWQKLRDKAQCLGEFGLSDWVDNHLGPVLDQFVEASQGNVDKEFWQSMFKVNDASGGPNISGWVNALFLYVTDYHGNLVKNHVLEDSDYGARNCFGGLGYDNLPSALSKVPFIWFYYDQEFEMDFVGGIVGVEQREDLSLKPKFGWAVQDRQK